MNCLSDALERAALRAPDRPAIIYGETVIPFAHLAGAVERLAAGLRGLGIGRGDRVGLILPNCPQFTMTYFATVRLGAVAVPLNPMLAPGEAAYIIADSGAKAIVAIGPTARLAMAAEAQTPGPQLLIVSGAELPEAAVSFEALLQSAPEGLPDPPGANDLAALLYTSGTTGKPKGAMLSHHNLLSNAVACLEAIALGEDDMILAVLPYFHSYGATVCMILPVVAGIPAVVLPKFESLPVLEALERTRATFFPGVPSMFAVLAAVKTERRFDLSALRKCISGGAPLPASVLRDFEARWGAELLEGYGPTEASPVVSCTRSVATRKIGSVGPPLPGVEVSIRDDDGRPLPVGEVGEIWVRGPNVMRGYWQDPDQTAQTLKDGWLLTGDLGRVDADGDLYIVDRKKDLIIVGGLNVYPRGVEDCILQIPRVRDVAVVGVKSPLHGERVRACLELHEGADLDPRTVIEHCSAHLAHYKVPRWVDIFPALPRNAVGKVLKRELRDMPPQEP